MLHTLWSTITNFSLLLTSHLLKTHAPHPAHVLSSVKFTVMLSLVHMDSVSVRSFQMALCGQKVNRSQIKLLKYELKVIVKKKSLLTQLYSEDLGSSLWGTADLSESLGSPPSCESTQRCIILNSFKPSNMKIYSASLSLKLLIERPRSIPKLYMVPQFVPTEQNLFHK